MFVRNNLRNDARVWKEARLLSRNGWRVRLIGVQTEGTAISEEHDGIQVERIALRPWDRELLPGGAGASPLRMGREQFAGRSGKRSKSARGLVGGVLREARRQWEPFHEKILADEFARGSLERIAENPSEIYHAHDINASQPAFLAKKRWGGKVVVDHHEFFSERNRVHRPGRFEKLATRRLEREVSQGADLNLTVSESIADELHARYRLVERPLVVMNVPERRSALLSKKALGARLGVAEPLLIYIGSATWNRGLEQVIAALSLRPAWNLAILGQVQDSFRPALEKSISQAGVAGRVHELGAVPHEEVAATAYGADVAVVFIQNVCLSYYYCSPNKLFEAFSAGVRVAASDFPDLRKVLDGSQAGTLCQSPASPDAVAHCIDAALALPSDQVSKAVASLADRYQWDVESTKLLSAYNRLLTKELLNA